MCPGAACFVTHVLPDLNRSCDADRLYSFLTKEPRRNSSGGIEPGHGAERGGRPMLEQLTDARCSQLSPREQHKLRCYEATIARGVRAHGDLGLALAGIRDARLYRAT